MTSKYLIFIFIFLSVACYFLFNQGDLNHTAESSYAFLEGHFFDFYSYNKEKVGGNDYLPSIYLIYSLVNTPYFFIANYATDSFASFLNNPLVKISWWKLTGLIFFISSGFVIHKIHRLLQERIKNNYKELNSAVLFITAPICFFCIFVFSGYDIVGIFFSLVGFYYLLKNNLLKFSLFFSIAITFKFFALIIFIPLLIYVEKNIFRIISYLIIGLSLTLLQILFFWNDVAFSEKIFSILLGKAQGGSHIFSKPVGLSLFFLWCCILYFAKYNNKPDNHKFIVFIPIVSYGLMFCSVIWHPQWIILLTPYFALSFMYIRNKFIYHLFEIIGMLSYTWLFFNIWPYNVDITMIDRGPLQEFMPKLTLIGKDFYSVHFFQFMSLVFHLYLFSPFLLNIFESKNKMLVAFNINQNNLPFYRLIIGLSFFLIPLIISMTIPLSVAKKINIMAYLNSQNTEVIQSRSETVVGEIYGSKTFTQSFLSPKNNLTGVSIVLATYARPVKGNLIFELLDENEIVLNSQVIKFKEIEDNHAFGFEFPIIYNSDNNLYYVRLSAPDAQSGSTITAWASNSDTYTFGELSNELGHKIRGDLRFNLHFMTSNNNIE